VDNLEEMAKNPYVDLFIFGPCDLSGSVGELNQVFGEKTQNLIKRSIEILKKAGKSIGISTGSDDPKVLKAWYDMGINAISAGAEGQYIVNGAKRIFTTLKNLK